MTESEIPAVVEFIRQLPHVTARAEFGDETFSVAGVRFAALTGDKVLMRLPPAELVQVIKGGLARPFVSVGAMGRNGWIEIRLDAIDPVMLERFLVAAHASVLQGRRRTARRPARARHRRPGRA